MKKAYFFFWMFMLCEVGGCIGRLARVLYDSRKHPEMYSPPYPSWLEKMDVDLIFTGVTVVVCAAAMIILKILMRKKEKNEEKQSLISEQTDA